VNFLRDFRYGLRLLVRHPGFTLSAVCTLALGIGANAAIFTVVHAVLLRPLPYDSPDRIVALWVTTPSAPQAPFAPANFLDLARDSRSFEHLAAYREDIFDVTVAGQNPTRLDGAEVSSAFFDVFGRRAIAGRAFSAADGASTDTAAVISAGAWARAFSEDPGIVGRTVQLNGQPFHIAGVMPADFAWPDATTDIWVRGARRVPAPPINYEEDFETQRGLSYLQVVGRVRAGVTLTQAQAELGARALDLSAVDPQNNAGRGMYALRLADQVAGTVRPALLMLLAAVAVVLLIAASNVAGLLMTRAAGRGREIGLRAALGASRGRVIGQLLAESFAIAVVAALVGLALASAGLRLLLAMVPADALPRASGIAIDSTVWLFTGLVAVGVTVVFGLLPAWRTSRADLAGALRDDPRTSTSGSRRLGSALVAIQVALAFVLLVGATLLLSSLQRLVRVDPGFRTAGVTAIDVPLPQARYATRARQADFYRALLDRLGSRPDTRSAAIFPLPFSAGAGSAAPIVRVDRPAPDPGQTPMALLSSITPGALETLGISLVAGRALTEADGGDAPAVALISAEAARRYWPGESPIDAKVTLGSDTPFTIVGVVGDIRRREMALAPEPVIYLSYRQFVLPYMTVLVQTGNAEAAVAADVRGAVRAIDPELPIGDVRPLGDAVAAAVSQPRFRSSLLSVFAALALVLAAIGVYGLMADVVQKRRREMGIRLALGATPRQVLGLVMRQGLVPVGVGLLIGGLGAVFASRLLATMLFGVGPNDPRAFAAVLAVLGAGAALAVYLPARRAAGVDPAMTLGTDG